MMIYCQSMHVQSSGAEGELRMELEPVLELLLVLCVCHFIRFLFLSLPVKFLHFDSVLAGPVHTHRGPTHNGYNYQHLMGICCRVHFCCCCCWCN